MGRQYYIDQRGDIVYAVRDNLANCNNCCYIPERKLGRCGYAVPADHVYIDSMTGEPRVQFCISERVAYRKVNK